MTMMMMMMMMICPQQDVKLLGCHEAREPALTVRDCPWP